MFLCLCPLLISINVHFFSVSVVSLVASVFTLSLIAFDRFYGIVFALKAHMMERKAKGSLFCVWSCAIAVGCPILISRNLHVRVWLDHVERWCDDGWPLHSNTADPTSRRIYYTFVAIVLYVFPMLVMTFTYTIILWKLNSTAMPGETIEREVILQARMKRKVCLPQSILPFLYFSIVKRMLSEAVLCVVIST